MNTVELWITFDSNGTAKISEVPVPHAQEVEVSRERWFAYQAAQNQVALSERQLLLSAKALS